MKPSFKRCFLPAFLVIFVLPGWSESLAQTVLPNAANAPQSDAGRQQGQPPPSAAEHKRQSNSDRSFLTARTQRTGNLVAAEDEDDNAVYRHSSSVRAIGRWLHIGPEAAARLFEYLNFGILAGGLLFFLMKYLPGMMRTRRETIQRQLAEARAATKEAEARLAVIEQKFAGLEQAIAGIRAQAEQEGTAEETRIRNLMEAERQRIIASAEQEIAVAASTARRDLKRFAGELAVDQAVKRLSLDEAGDRVLIQRFMQDFSEQTRLGGRN